ncbi:hypothetical protein Ahy_B03g067547 isoform A [Arachis hypogaea]|uniref:Uncharacterized protein n=1 Tax=Arachis hypogaea TaxID=3818 RepID=A0A445A737_ARAHY|nr:hypothetical protein Ahy_B03g067547 isoform A [Arachis hypogaea]
MRRGEIWRRKTYPHLTSPYLTLPSHFSAIFLSISIYLSIYSLFTSTTAIPYSYSFSLIICDAHANTF